MNEFIEIAPNILIILFSIIVACLLIDWTDALCEDSTNHLMAAVSVAWTMRIEIPSDYESTFARKSRSTPPKT